MNKNKSDSSNRLFIRDTLILFILLDSSYLLEYFGLNDDYHLLTKRTNSILAMGKKVSFEYLLRVFFKDILKKFNLKDKKLAKKEIRIQLYNESAKTNSLISYTLAHFNKLNSKQIKAIKNSLLFLIDQMCKHVSVIQNKKFSWRSLNGKSSTKSKNFDKHEVTVLTNKNYHVLNRTLSQDKKLFDILFNSLFIKKPYNPIKTVFNRKEGSLYIYNIKGLYKVNKFFLNRLFSVLCFIPDFRINRHEGIIKIKSIPDFMINWYGTIIKIKRK